VDLVLLDWTRMGKTYCLAGVIVQDGQPRVVRPLPSRNRDSPVRNVGWSPYLLDGHSRWQLFELVAPEPAFAQPPHLEDVWVRLLRPRNELASPARRRTILQETTAPADKPLFGEELNRTRTAAYLMPGKGNRSLATVVVPAEKVTFGAVWREGTAEPDYRVTLDLPGLAQRTMAVKDHFLLRRAELASSNLNGQLRELARAVRQMGDQVAVRIGLSRAFQASPGRGEGFCWLMADGFFSLTDPQP
jgi:hypothetical protein